MATTFRFFAVDVKNPFANIVKLFNTIVVVAIVIVVVAAIVVVVSVSVLGFAFGFYAYCNRQFGAIHS